MSYSPVVTLQVATTVTSGLVADALEAGVTPIAGATTAPTTPAVTSAATRTGLDLNRFFVIEFTENPFCIGGGYTDANRMSTADKAMNW